MTKNLMRYHTNVRTTKLSWVEENSNSLWRLQMMLNFPSASCDDMSKLLLTKLQCIFPCFDPPYHEFPASVVLCHSFYETLNPFLCCHCFIFVLNSWEEGCVSLFSKHRILIKLISFFAVSSLLFQERWSNPTSPSQSFFHYLFFNLI